MSDPGLGLRLRATAELRSVPGLLHVLNLLPCGQTEISTRVDAVLAENPMLERGPGGPCPTCGRHTRSRRCASCRYGRTDPDAIAYPLEELPTLALCEVRADCRSFMSTLLAHLSTRGLLDSDPADIASLHEVPASTVAECIRAVQAVGPPGIGERTAGGLLAAQARSLVEVGSCGPWVVELLRDNLALVATRDSEHVADLYGVSVAEADRTFAVIVQRLRPYVSVGDETVPRSPPDVIVHRDAAGALAVDVADSGWFGLRVVDIPPDLASDPRASAWLKVHRDTANDFIRQLDSRANMIAVISRAAVEYQAEYLDEGARAHRPLTRADLAASLGVSESTVSRAVKDKRLQLPDGSVVDLADLFGKAVAVRAELGALAATASMSDRQLSELLAARGFAVSRRTVAKYRSQLGIGTRGLRRTLR